MSDFRKDSGNGRDQGRDRNQPRRIEARVPPHNLNAEESLLGALLLSRDVVGQVAELGLQVEHFYKPAHQHIYSAIRGLMANGHAVDIVTVADELRRNGLLDDIGGAQSLNELQNATPAISNAHRYAKIVQDTAVLRKLISVAGEITEIAYMEPDDVTKALDEAETKVFEVAEDRVVDSTRPLSDLLPIAMDKLQETFERGDTITGVATGFNDLDEILSGLQPSTLNIIGARPAMGKCVAWDTPMVDPRTGAMRTAAEIFDGALGARSVPLLSLDDDASLVETEASHLLDDGVKPLFLVETRADVAFASRRRTRCCRSTAGDRSSSSRSATTSLPRPPCRCSVISRCPTPRSTSSPCSSATDPLVRMSAHRRSPVLCQSCSRWLGSLPLTSGHRSPGVRPLERQPHIASPPVVPVVAPIPSPRCSAAMARGAATPTTSGCRRRCSRPRGSKWPVPESAVRHRWDGLGGQSGLRTHRLRNGE